MHALQSKGVKAVATEIASKNFPPVGHNNPLPQQLENHYPRQLGASKFKPSRASGSSSCKPLPKPQTSSNSFTLEEERCMQEIQGMVNKHAISWMGNTQERFPNVLCPKKGWRAETCNKRPTRKEKNINF